MERLHYLKQLQKLWVMIISTAITVYHLCRKRVGKSSDVLEKIGRSFQKVIQKNLVFKVLVRDVCDSSLDIQDVVYHAVDHAPVISVPLEVVNLLVPFFTFVMVPICRRLTITTRRRSPLATFWPINISGRSE